MKVLNHSEDSSLIFHLMMPDAKGRKVHNNLDSRNWFYIFLVFKEADVVYRKHRKAGKGHVVTS